MSDVSSGKEGTPEMDRRHGERRMTTEELLIRLDERVASLIDRIDKFSPTLEEMRNDIRQNTERSLSNKSTTDRHESLINWGMRIVFGTVIGAVLWVAGLGPLL